MLDDQLLSPEEVAEWTRIRGISTAYHRSRILHEACERSVFTALQEEPGTAEDLALRLSLHPVATRMLLEALAAMDLLTVEDGVYANALGASRFLVEGAPLDQTEIVALNRRHLESWEGLAEALHCGYNTPVHREFEPRFVHAMHCTGSVVAPMVVRAVGTGDVVRVLDLGGGPGSYAIHFALARPDLRAEVLELEPVVPIAREYAQLYGVSERVTARAGDYHTTDLGTDWDLVLLSNILHSFDREACRTLLRRVHAALRPGGRAVINEFVRSGRGDGPAVPAFFALHMLLRSSGGDTFTWEELEQWLEEAGFRELERHPLTGTDHSVLVGRKV